MSPRTGKAGNRTASATRAQAATMPQADKQLKTAVLAVATLSSFLMPFMASSVNIAIPSIGKDLSMGAILLSWIATGYLLAAAMFVLPCGRLADIYGRKRLFTIGIMIFTVFSLLCAMAPNALTLIAFRFFQGVGASMMVGISIALISSVFPPGERGKALGIATAAVYIGLSVGPFFGGIMTQNLGWRAVFLSNVPWGIIMLVNIAVRLKGEWAEARGERFDLVGGIIYSAGLAMVVYGFSLIPDMSGFLLTVIGILTILGFIAWESRTDTPLLDLGIFRRNVVFAFSNIAALVNYASTSAVTFLLSIYLQTVRLFTPQTAGIILVSQSLMQAAFSPVAGKLSDKVEPRIVSSVGMTFTVLGLLVLTFLREDTHIAVLVLGLVLLGTGFGLFSSPNTNAIMSSVEKKLYGVSAATLATMRIVGQILSMGITMLIFSVYIGHEQITYELRGPFLTSAIVAFTIFTVLCFFGIFASLARGRLRGRDNDVGRSKGSKAGASEDE